MGLLSKALKLFREVSNASNLELGSLGIVKVYIEQGNMEAASNELNKILQTHPDDKYAKLELGKFLLRSSRDEDATEFYNELLCTNNDSPAMTELMFIDIKKEDYKFALYRLNKIYDNLENSEQIKNYLHYKLGLPIENSDYYIRQLMNYSYNAFNAKMNTKVYSSFATAANTQLDESLREKLYSEINKKIRSYNPVSSSIFNKYIIDMGGIVGVTNDKQTSKLMVITFVNSYDILLFYPVSMEYGVSQKNKKMILN